MATSKAVASPVLVLLNLGVRAATRGLTQRQQTRLVHQFRSAAPRGWAGRRRAAVPAGILLGARALSSSSTATPKGSAWQVLSFAFRGLFFTGLGFSAVLLVGVGLRVLTLPVSSGDGAVSAADAAEAQAIEDYINSHPVVAQLRADPDLVESRPHGQTYSLLQRANLTGATLRGPGKMAVPAFQWDDGRGGRIVQILHVGPQLCGHPNIVHGGFVATVLDEGLARGCFRALPGHMGMTAYLNIDYRAPTPAGSYVMLTGQTVRTEGRKAWVEGRLETLPPAQEAGGKPVLLAEAEALYVSPKALWMLEYFPLSRIMG